jgi:arylsulfatase A-like enzyme
MDRMTRREYLKRMACGTLGTLGGVSLLTSRSSWAAQTNDRKINFVFILIDDMGWTDVACYGSKFYETPNIDRLCGQGVKFTNAYAACTVCSPTRASILTGKYPARLHITDWIEGHKRPYARLQVPDWTMYLPLEEVTLAEALKPLGYVSASIGKWHLGKEPYYPEKQGFDLNFGGTDKGQPPSYFYPYKIPNIQTGEPGEYLSDRLTTEAENFMEANKDRPFLLYLPHFAVHTPLQARQNMIARYKAKVKPGQAQRNATYAAMVESVDESVGRIMKKMDDLQIADRTVVFFMSDNGGLIGSTSNLPLRAGKGSAYEGGVREPMIVRWPGVAKPGSVCDEPVISVDFYPTILEMAGVKPDPKQIVDGVSLVPLLEGTGRLDRNAIFWHYPHYHPGGATPYGAVRQGDFRLVEFYEDNRVELYNLRDDIGEKNDLTTKMPEKAAEMRKLLADWRRSVGVQMPTPNPDYDPAKDGFNPRKKDQKKARQNAGE